MPLYRDILANFAAEKEHIDWALIILKNARVKRFTEAAVVIASDEKCPVEFWREFAEGIARLRDLDEAACTPEEIENIFVSTCRNFLLKGPSLDFQPRAFGRIIEFTKMVEIYFNHLSDSIGALSYQQVEQQLNTFALCDELIMNFSVPECPLGTYFMWSTYSHPCGEVTDPFHPCREPMRLPDELGLQEGNITTAASPSYMAFAYNLPADVDPKSPTVAEGYAGSFENIQFRPIGYTSPIKANSVGRPECVHETITAQELIKRPAMLPEPWWKNR